MTLSDLSKDYLGPSYNYAAQIKGPKEIGMSDGADFGALAKDVGGLIKYIEVLVSGPSDALDICNNPLGNRYFLKTLANCTDMSSGDIVARSIYVNNIPTGNIPFISDLTGKDINMFKGLVPGVMENLEVLDPITIGEAMFLGTNPKCASMELPTQDSSGNITQESAYILLNDLYNLDPCAIGDHYCKPDFAYKDGFTYAPQCCVSAFTNMSPAPIKNSILDDKFTEIYFILLGILGLYITLRLLHKSR